MPPKKATPKVASQATPQGPVFNCFLKHYLHVHSTTVEYDLLTCQLTSANLPIQYDDFSQFTKAIQLSVPDRNAWQTMLFERYKESGHWLTVEWEGQDGNHISERVTEANYDSVVAKMSSRQLIDILCLNTILILVQPATASG